MKKKVLAALLAVCMVASMMLVPAMAADEDGAEPTFPDVAADAWYAGSVERWAGYGILKGNDDGTFKPEDAMTRAQFAKVVVDLLGLPHEDTDMPFEDVIGTKDEWAAGHIAAARKAGFINGRTDTKFAPGEPVSFNDSAAILGRALGLVDQKAYGETVTEKLTELGMLDENVNADAEANRALVAALADNMIGVYVTPESLDEVAEDGVITGEGVKGVILVVGGEDGLAVTVKDATVPSIVMNGGNVTLSGETTVDAVKVGGGNATVVAEEGTTVGEVTVEGTNVNVSLDGKVDSVTVTEDATISHLEGKGVSTENVVNESANEIKVNDETVAAKPVEENPDDNKGEGDEDFEGTGLVPTPSKPAENPEEKEDPGKTEQKPTDKNDAGAVTVPGDATAACTGEHTWGAKEADGNKAATCEEAGYDVYTCTKEGCGATKKVSVPALGHNFYKKTVAGATCTEEGTITWACANSAECKKFPAAGQTAATNEEKIAALGHTKVNAPAVAATCTETGKTGGIVCGREGCNAGEDGGAYVWSGCTETKALGHNYKADAPETEGANVTSWTCTRCTEGEGHTTTTCPNTDNHSKLAEGVKCPMGCGEVGKKAETKPTSHTCTDFTWQLNTSTGVCTGTCQKNDGTTHSETEGKKTHQHVSGQKNNDCGNTYYNNEGTWSATDPNANKDGQ